LSKRFGDFTAVSGISFAMKPGEILGLLGPNGAGKSVLMRICYGLLQPTGGSVRWKGQVNGRRGQAMVFQRPVMLRRSAFANVIYGLKLAGITAHLREQRACDVLEAVGLTSVSSRPARVLSGGEQQRLALARAWSLNPEILLLDEPTANLDPGATRDVESIINQIHASGTKIVMTTHNLGQARRLGDEILFLSHGRLVERSTVERFFQQPATAEAAAFIRGELPWN